MADDRTKIGAQDRAQINLGEPYEIRDWCAKLNCTESELRTAVAAVGSGAAKVLAYFEARK